MKSVLASVLIAASLLLPGCKPVDLFQSQAMVQTQEVRFPREAVVHIEVEDRGVVCSAVAIDKHVVLTAAHCVTHGFPYTVLGQKAAVLKISEELDLAVLVTEAEHPVTVKLGKTPEVDSKIVTIGYPLGAAQVATEGRVQQIGVIDKKHYMLVDSPVIFGNSGGGVFALQDGEYKLVGITSAMMAAGGFFPVTHMALMVHVDVIKEFTNLGIRG